MNQFEKKNRFDCPSLFLPFKVGSHQLRNRLVALPVHTGFAYPDGCVSPWMIKCYSRLAESGVAMVVVANVAVSSDGAVSRFNLRADRDEFIPGLAKLATAIKKKGALASLQLNHAGRFAKTDRPLLPSPVTSENLSFNIEALKSFMEFFPFEKRFNLTRYLFGQLNKWRQAMTSQDRNRVIDAFALSAARAYKAGFDMVELHGANGYLLCQYLSPFTNKTGSGFGGDFKGRTTFPLAVIKAVKDSVPKEFPVGYRLILKEWVPFGIELPEALAFAQMLEKKGIAYLSASVGTYNSMFFPAAIKTMAKPAYLKKEMVKLTRTVTVPTIISGRVTSPRLADALVRDNVADLIGLGRSLRADPRWVAKAMDNRLKIKICVNCNQCLKQVVLEQGFNCRRWSRVARERSRLEHRLITRNYKAVWIIADTADIQTFKAVVPFILLAEQNSRFPDVLILRAPQDRAVEQAQNRFVQWMKERFESGETDSRVHYRIEEHTENIEKSVQDEILLKAYGQVFIRPDRTEPWRDRLLYKQRGKVMVRLCANAYLADVIVPVDLSPASLLVMIFLRKTLMKKKDVHIRFVHVLTGKSIPVELQWEKMKKITDFEDDIPLQCVQSKTSVVSTIVQMIVSGKFGTVVMGKRGISGIKRWLLGSVSSGVLNNLTDQTLFLID